MLHGTCQQRKHHLPCNSMPLCFDIMLEVLLISSKSHLLLITSKDRCGLNNAAILDQEKIGHRVSCSIKRAHIYYSKSETTETKSLEMHGWPLSHLPTYPPTHVTMHGGAGIPSTMQYIECTFPVCRRIYCTKPPNTKGQKYSLFYSMPLSKNALLPKCAICKTSGCCFDLIVE